MVAPKRAALAEANKRLDGANKKLSGIRAKVKELKDRVASLEDSLMKARTSDQIPRHQMILKYQTHRNASAAYSMFALHCMLN